MKLNVKDPGSALTHFIAMILAALAAAPLIIRAFHASGWFHAAALAVFIVSMILLYAASTIYHTFNISEHVNKILRKIDHMMIFILIAGTYTPYTLVSLRDSVGWWVFGVIWATAIVGIVLNAVSLKKFSKISVALYLIMGWMIIIAYQPMVQAIPSGGMKLLVWGGIAYTLGAILYGIGSRKKYFHSIFHFFCLIGTVLHFLSIYLYVM